MRHSLLQSFPIRLILAALLIIAVLAVFISPAFDSPETVLQAKQRALQIALALIAVAMLLQGLVAPHFVCEGFAFAPDRAGPSSSLSNSGLPLLC